MNICTGHLFNYKINNMIFFVYSGMIDYFYIICQYIKYPQFLFFSNKMNMAQKKGFMHNSAFVSFPFLLAGFRMIMISTAFNYFIITFKF